MEDRSSTFDHSFSSSTDFMESITEKREKEIEPAPQNEKEVHLCLL